jgi:hypothetical protein
MRIPISSEETHGLGCDRAGDEFHLLQGDIFSTETAYFPGERVTNSPKYVVLSSPCDSVPARRKHAALLRVLEIRESDSDFAAKMNLF